MLVAVERSSDLEPKPLQQVFHRGRVVGRVLEFGETRIVGLPDHQRDTAQRLVLRLHRGECEQQRDDNAGEQAHLKSLERPRAPRRA
jgi:hypothetical protein